MLLWIVLLCGLGAYCYYLSRLQPFPEKGNRFAMVLFSGALILWISSTSPEEAGGDLPGAISAYRSAPLEHWFRFSLGGNFRSCRNPKEGG